MKANVGKVDRVVRVAAGLALIGMAFGGVIGGWGYLGIVPLLSGAVGLCPLYSVLGINTCPLGAR